MILPTQIPTSSCKTIWPTLLSGFSAKKRFKKITESFVKIRFSIIGACIKMLVIPFRWLPEILSVFPFMSQLIIKFAFFRIPQNLVGFSNFFEIIFGCFFFVNIRMIFSSQFPVGFFYLICCCITSNPKYSIVILVCCGHSKLRSFNTCFEGNVLSKIAANPFFRGTMIYGIPLQYKVGC